MQLKPWIKWIAILVGAFALTLVVVRLVSDHKDAEFDKRLKEKETEVQQLTGDRDRLLGEIEQIKKERQALQAQLSLQEQAVAASGKKVEEARKEVLNENQRYEADLVAANGVTDRVAVCEDLCARLKKAGLFAKDKPCNCQ